ETRRSTCQAPISEPRYCTDPEQLPVDGKDPMMEFSKVDLPAPLPPMTVTMLPRVTAILAPTTALTLPYRVERSVTCRMGCLGLLTLMTILPSLPALLRPRAYRPGDHQNPFHHRFRQDRLPGPWGSSECRRANLRPASYR